MHTHSYLLQPASAPPPHCRSGPLAFTTSARLHMGYDGWFNKEKQVYDMEPLDDGAVAHFGLPKGASWCSAAVDIPSSAAVVDFVLSDK